MNRSTGMSSRMSSYQYTKKTTTWKWTAGKIAGLSMFGLVMVTLVYLESTSTYDAPSLTIQEPVESESTFDKDYEDFLKQGVKVIPQEILDSIREAEENASTQILSSDNNVGKTSEKQIESSKTQSPRELEPSNSAPKPADNSQEPAKDRVVENNLGTIELSPPPAKKTPQDKTSSLGLGTLQETSPPDDTNKPDQSASIDKTITEEFYTEEVITGRTMAASDGTPIEGVLIKVKGTERSGVSDANGQYSITVPGDPEHRIIQYSFQGNITERDVAPGTDVVNIRF